MNVATTIAQAMLALLSALIGWALLFPQTSPLTFGYAAAAMTALLIGVGLYDWIRGQIRNEITYPLMLVGFLRALVLHDPSFLVLWTVLLLLFTTNILAGGDIKLMMALAALWPTPQLVGVWVVVTIVTHTPVVLYKHVLKRARQSDWIAVGSWLQIACWRLWALDLPSAGQWTELLVSRLPSEKELAEKGERFAFSIALVGIVYLYVFTPAGLAWNGTISF